MAEKKKIKGLKKWLKENGYTEEQMQAFWDELIPLNKTVKALYDCGYNWDETNIHILAQLPTEKERTLKRLAEIEQKEKEEQEKKAKEQADKQYYEEHFEEIILNKIDNNEKLTESEIRTLVNEYEISEEAGDDLRWHRCMYTIIEIKGRKFSIAWLRGLTEYQENEYTNQPVEVTITQRVKIERKRFVVMTSDKTQIFVGIARNMHFKDVNNIGDVSVKTYLSEKKAKSSFLQSWYGSEESDFEPGGKYIVVPIIETLAEV